MTEKLRPIRRVVTGNDAHGRSRVLFDGAAPNVNPGAVSASAGCGQKRLFHKLTGSEPGIADGWHSRDRSDGKLLGRIRIPDHCTNMAWGDADWRSLYITAYGSIFRTRVSEPGVPVW